MKMYIIITFSKNENEKKMLDYLPILSIINFVILASVFILTYVHEGDEKCQVHMEGYSVSNQCMALVKDDCLVPTKDVPELGFIRESSDKQYVPDVYYKVSFITVYVIKINS